MAEIRSKADLLAQGYGGYTGWGEAEALANYRDTGGAGKYDPSVSGGATTGGGATDYASIARQMLEQQQQANIPAVTSLQAQIPEIAGKYATQRTQLEAGKEPLKARYDQLLKDITSRTELAAGREFGRRGIPLSSGVYETALAERIAPETERIGLEKETGLRGLTDLIANLTGQETGEQRAVSNAIAQLQAGGASSAITNALQMYQMQQQEKSQTAQRTLQERISQAELAAKQPEKYATLSEGQTLYNLLTGQAEYKAGKTYKEAVGAGEWE